MSTKSLLRFFEFNKTFKEKRSMDRINTLDLPLFVETESGIRYSVSNISESGICLSTPVDSEFKLFKTGRLRLILNDRVIKDFNYSLIGSRFQNERLMCNLILRFEGDLITGDLFDGIIKAYHLKLSIDACLRADLEMKRAIADYVFELKTLIEELSKIILVFDLRLRSPKDRLLVGKYRNEVIKDFVIQYGLDWSSRFERFLYNKENIFVLESEFKVQYTRLTGSFLSSSDVDALKEFKNIILVESQNQIVLKLLRSI